jgi:hypothetical protein
LAHRVHSHAAAAAALINLCEGVTRDTLRYLNRIVERLLKLLDSARVGRHVQERTITTLAMVARASEVTFAKVLPVWEKGKAELELDADTLVELLMRKQCVSYYSERQG